MGLGDLWGDRIDDLTANCRVREKVSSKMEIRCTAG